MEGDAFNGVFDRQTSLWDAVTQLCQICRCMPIVEFGIIRILRDDATDPVGVFTPRNMVEGQFKLDYIFSNEDTPDHMEVEWINPNKNWAQDFYKLTYGEVLQQYDHPEKRPWKLNLFGVTNLAQVKRLANYYAKSNLYRRLELSFATEMEGLILTWGDTIKVAYDVPNWGEGGEILGIDASDNLILSTSIMFESSGNKILFRQLDGSPGGEYAVEEVLGSLEKVMLSGSWSYDKSVEDQVTITKGADSQVIYFGESKEKTHFIFKNNVNNVKDFKVTGLRSSSDGQTSVMGAINDLRVYPSLEQSFLVGNTTGHGIWKVDPDGAATEGEQLRTYNSELTDYPESHDVAGMASYRARLLLSILGGYILEIDPFGNNTQGHLLRDLRELIEDGTIGPVVVYKDRFLVSFDIASQASELWEVDPDGDGATKLRAFPSNKKPRGMTIVSDDLLVVTEDDELWEFDPDGVDSEGTKRRDLPAALSSSSGVGNYKNRLMVVNQSDAVLWELDPDGAANQFTGKRDLPTDLSTPKGIIFFDVYV